MSVSTTVDIKMLSQIKKFIKEEKYAEILKLKTSNFNNYKCVAAILLEKYEDALKYSQSFSYERAYILYKLKHHKNALKVLKKLEGKDSKVIILKAQCYYNRGMYFRAAELLAKINKNELGEEGMVNLNAAVALAKITQSNKRLSSEKESRLLNSGGNNKETKMECEYNKSFENIENEEKFLINLKALEVKYPEATVIKKQIVNIESNAEDLPEDSKLIFSDREKFIYDYNKHRIFRPRKLHLFQYYIYKYNQIINKEYQSGKAIKVHGIRFLYLRKILCSLKKDSAKYSKKLVSRALSDNKPKFLNKADLAILNQIYHSKYN